MTTTTTTTSNQRILIVIVIITILLKITLLLQQYDFVSSYNDKSAWNETLELNLINSSRRSGEMILAGQQIDLWLEYNDDLDQLNVSSSPSASGFSFQATQTWEGSSRQVVGLTIGWADGGEKTLVISSKRYAAVSRKPLLRLRFTVIPPVCRPFGTSRVDFQQTSRQRVVYCTQQCQLVDWMHPDNQWLWENVTLLMAGNSHIRNLFRSAADRLSSHQSLADRNLCDLAAGHRRLGGHCFDSQNLSPLHNFDYYFSSKSIQLHNYWTVLWTVNDSSAADRTVCSTIRDNSTSSRSDYTVNRLLSAAGACGQMNNNSSSLINGRIRQYCSNDNYTTAYRVRYNDPASTITNKHRCLIERKWSRKSVDYAGPRIGIDFVRTAVLPRMLSDPRAYFVFNVYRDWWGLEELIGLILSPQNTHRTAKDRLILIIDARAQDDHQIMKRHVDRWRASGLAVIDLRSAYNTYFKQEMTDASGPGKVGGHLFGPLQRLLLDHLLSAVLRHRYASTAHTRQPLKLRPHCARISND